MILSLLFACWFEDPPPEIHHLSDLYHPVLRVSTGHADGAPEQVRVMMHPELNGKCHPMDAITATLGGKPMTRLHGRVEGEVPYDRDCTVFEFSMDAKDVTDTPTTEVLVSDGVTTFRSVVAGAISPRTLTPTTAQKVKAGDVVTFQWAPATDVVAPKGKVGVDLHAGEKRVVVGRKDITFAPGTLTFAMPEGIHGEVEVSMVGTTFIQPTVLACEGAFKCEASRLYTVEPVKIIVE